MFATFLRYPDPDPAKRRWSHGASCNEIEEAAYRLAEFARTYGDSDDARGYVFDVDRREVVGEFEAGLSSVTLERYIFCPDCLQRRVPYQSDATLCMNCYGKRCAKAELAEQVEDYTSELSDE